MSSEAPQIQDLTPQCPVEPFGEWVVIWVPEVEEYSKGGILMAGAESRDRERKGTAHGYVVAIGPQAWQEVGDGSPWCEVGDHVTFPRYEAGVIAVDGLDHGEWQMIHDTEIRGRLL